MTAATTVARAYQGAEAAAPAGVQAGQWVADSPEDTVVVFLIGMRINRWRRVRSWWPAFVGMPRMLAELQKHPEAGLLAAKSYWAGRDLITVQYWRSAEQLGRFARDPAMTHQPTWSRHNKRAAATGDVGIWHESYVVPAASIESLYANMPAIGLGRALGAVPRTQARRTRAHELIGRQEGERVSGER
jgi:hypothetical protein